MDNKTKPLITLATIVGQEEAVISRYIHAFFDAVDHMVFVQAVGGAAPDLSMALAKMTCEDLKIPATFLEYKNQAGEYEHVDNFAAARQVAWDAAAATGADYLMWADCDDTLAAGSAEAISTAATEAKYDVYVIPYKVGGFVNVAQEVMRERLVRNTGKSRWRYSVHEQLRFDAPVSYSILRDAMVLHEPHATKAGGHHRNVNILHAATEDAARNFFYLHQEYFRTNQHEKSKDFGEAAISAGGLDTLEAYEILLNLAQMETGAKAKEYAARAFETMPERREALALLANYAIIDKNHEKALLLARMMMGLGKPKRSYWSLNCDWYGWKGSELYMQALRLNGQSTEEFEQRYREGAAPVFSIIHATLGRPEKALGIREMWLSRAHYPERVEYIYGLHEGDAKSGAVLAGFQHTVSPEGCGCPTNYDTAAGAARGKVLVQAQDDCYPPAGWDDMLIEAIGDLDAPCFVAVSDGTRKDKLCVNSIMTAAYAKQKAAKEGSGCGFFPRAYDGTFADTENTYRAYLDAAAGEVKLAEAKHIVIYHDHPHYNPAIPWDSTYEAENSTESTRRNCAVFHARNPQAASDKVLQFDGEPAKVEAS